MGRKNKKGGTEHYMNGKYNYVNMAINSDSNKPLRLPYTSEILCKCPTARVELRRFVSEIGKMKQDPQWISSFRHHITYY